jgi:outer membrane receptor protein involved in Fe transport
MLRFHWTGADARIVSRYHWTTGVWDGDIPASQVVNLNAGYRINSHLRMYVTATSLFDQQRFQVYGGSVIGRRILAGATSLATGPSAL